MIDPDLLEQAERCRRLANGLPPGEMVGRMLTIADDFERLARQAGAEPSDAEPVD